jgi:hypothetical protein
MHAAPVSPGGSCSPFPESYQPRGPLECQIERMDSNSDENVHQRQAHERENDRHGLCAVRLRRDIPETHREGGD